jgi:hypothetical protein
VKDGVETLESVKKNAKEIYSKVIAYLRGLKK